MIIQSFDVKGDVIITDPCYISEWVSTKHVNTTYYGDWSCTVFTDDDEKRKLGDFCADGGQVCVMSIPSCPNKKKIEEWVESHKHCATILKKFNGHVDYVLKTSFYASKGEWHSEDNLIIRGKGKKNGRNFSFFTMQTGL